MKNKKIETIDMCKNTKNLLKNVELLQNQRDNIIIELEQLLTTKENELNLIDTGIISKITEISYEPLEYNTLVTTFPKSIFFDGEGFLGITHDQKHLYEINTVINLLTLKLYSSEKQFSHINSLERFYIWQKLIDDHFANGNIIFVFDKKIHELIFNVETKKLKTLIKNCNEQIDELVDIMICKDEMGQYEDVEE